MLSPSPVLYPIGAVLGMPVADLLAGVSGLGSKSGVADSRTPDMVIAASGLVVWPGCPRSPSGQPGGACCWHSMS